MKRKSLLIMLLVALFVPLAMNAQTKMHKNSINGSTQLETKVLSMEMPSNSLLSQMELISMRDFLPYTPANEGGDRATRDVGDYELVTASQTDWSGDYVIAYVASTTSATVLTGSGGNYYGAGSSFTMSNNVLAASDVANYNVTIAKDGNYYTLKLGTQYLGLTADQNRLYFSTSTPSSNNYRWTISYSNNTLKIFNANYTNREIQWNSSTFNGLRFACYKSTQNAISLFKKDESSCAKPQGLTVDETSITESAATVTWAAGDASQWNLQYKKSSASTWISVNGLTAATYTFSGLEAGSVYEVQVQADCGGEQSGWTDAVSFMTECSIQSLPFFCGFESEAEYGCISGSGWADNTGLYNSTYHAGSYCFGFEGNGYWQYLIFPEFDGTTAVAVSFYYRLRSSSYQHYFMLGYATESDLSDLEFGAQETATSQSYMEYTATFPVGTRFVVLACGATSGTYYRLFVDDFNFTDPGCVGPDGLAATDITPHSAHLAWTNIADSYNVRYRKAGSEREVFFDSFENGIDNWTTRANSYNNSATNWRQFNATNFSSGNVTNHTGDYVAMSRSYDGSTDRTVDNWLISPQIALDGELRYWVRNGDGANYYEHYAVYVSTSGTSTSDFTLLFDPNDATDDWLLHVVDLSSFNGVNGYIAFRHNDTGKDFLLLDDVGVYTVEYGPWMTATPNGNECDIVGLDSESTYQWQVQTVCGNDDTSDWSSAYFQTLSACSAPTDLSTTDVTATSATLTWADYQESYNVRYKPVFFFEGFEDGIPSTWTTIDSDGDGNTWIALSDIPSHYSQYSAEGVSAWARTGTDAACSPSYVNTSSSNGTAFDSDQWLITPLLDLQGTLKFYITSAYADEYEVKLSTRGTNVSDFTTTLQAMSAVSANWDEVEIDLSSYAGQQGYIAIHHVFEDGYFLIVDDFSISGNAWETSSATTNTLTINGLTLNTTYEWQVSGANCNEWSSTANFTTLDGILVTEISADDVTVTVGQTATITPTVLPADATDPTVTYTSNNEAIATVTTAGVVTGIGVGETTITITSVSNPTVSTTINVTVNGIDVTEITADDVEVVNGETATISYTVAPTDATDQSVTFTSANTNIAIVDANGVVTGVNPGETTITIASVSNPEVTAEITVTVTSNPNAVQFTVNAPANAATGDVITVEAVLTAPTSGNYAGFNGLTLGIDYDPEAFQFVMGSIVQGPVAQAALQLDENAMIQNFTNINASIRMAIIVPTEGIFVTTEGVVFSAQFTVLAQTGEFTFTAQPNIAGNFNHEADLIPYEATPSTVTIAAPEQYTRTITGYGTGTGNWYLIASPIGDVAPTEVTNMLSNNYDLFYFDDAKENEWVNYKPNTSGQGNPSTNPGFGLEKGKGYLYANSETVDLIFTGYALTTTEETVELDYTGGDGVDLPGWNLVGNPFAEIAYLAGNCAFYTMDSDGNFTSTTNASIEAMEGIFVEVRATGQTLTFTTEQQAKSPVLNLNLSNGRKVIDRAIVRFDGGKQLSKLQFRQGSTKVYIPVESHDYAVVNSEEMGEMPVSFKAEENGTYTFSFNAEEVSFAYLHLIDNMTGADVDLLETSSYSFEAKTTDYESRFKLVFATGNNSNSDNFAYFSNGSFVINNEGNAELQVIDIMGRIVKSESINGCANVSVNGAAGVYMLRLINGDNVKVQKVVVK